MAALRGSRGRSGPQERDAHNVGMTVRPWSHFDSRAEAHIHSKSARAESRKIKGAQVVRQKGMLANLLSMPLDITFDIFSRLKLRDVLYISWTSKAFHEVLSRPSAAWVWKSARRHEPGLPPPPSDLNEAQYACLMFDHHCQICGQKVQKIHWVVRIRCCNKCAGKPGHFIMARNFNQFLPQNLIQLVADALPSFADPRPARHYDVPALYRKEEVRAFSKAIIAVRGDKEKIKAMVDKSTAAVKRRYEEAPRYERWLLQERVDDAYTSQNLRETRYNDVISKLKELGWEHELREVTNPTYRWPGKLYTNLEFLRKHPLVNQKKELTDRIWKNCRDEFVALMEDVKKDREEAARLPKTVERERLAKPVWYEYVQTRPLSEALPSVADVCETGPFRELIDKPLDIKITAADFKGLTAQLPTFCEEWRTHARATLLDLLPNTKSSGKGRKTKRSKVTVDAAALDRASTFFKCTKCHLPATTEEAMIHRCAVIPLRPSLLQPNPIEWDTDIYRYNELNVCTWNHQGVFEFNEKVSTIARDVVLLCGLDPEHASPQDLNALGVRLICDDCSAKAIPKLNCMTWRCAVSHIWSHQSHRLRVLTSKKDDAKVKTLEEMELRSVQQKFRSWQWYDRVARCKHCHECVEERLWNDHRRQHDLEHHFEDNALEWHNIPPPWPIYFVPEDTKVV